MKNRDKIVQIVQANDRYTMHALSERGRIYALKTTDQYSWECLVESPEICPTCDTPLTILENGKVAECSGCGYTEA